MRIISKRNGFKGVPNAKHKKQQRLIGRIHNAKEYALGPEYGTSIEHLEPVSPLS